MKKPLRKILFFIGITVFVIYIIIMLFLTSSTGDKILCAKINVEITNIDKLKLISPDDIISIIKTNQIPTVGIPINDINITAIKELLEKKTYIENVKIYTTIDGLLNVKLSQREPIVRIHVPSGEGFYMNYDGFVFPLSRIYTHYVPVVTINCPLPFNLPYKGNLPDKRESKILRELLEFIEFLKKEDFWNSEIVQINILPNQEVELIPRTGDYVILLGNLYNYKYKLKKLLVFYERVLLVDGWNKYSLIDLRFSKLIVARFK
jgi:cell division protein FtsQ